MDLDNLTVKQIKQIQSLLRGPREENTSPYQLGQNYFIRTVTHHYTGKLVRVTAKELVLEDAAWIADDGRFYDALKTGNLNEVEPFPSGEVIVGRGAIIDACRWLFDLPKEQK